MLLISGNEFDKGRVGQHQVVIDAAKAAGVALLAYTSAPGSLTATLADDHRATEQALLASGLPYSLLRNGWYHENYTENLAPVLEHGAVVQAMRRRPGLLRRPRRLRRRGGRGAHRRGPREHDVRAGRRRGVELRRVRGRAGKQTGREIAYTPVSVEALTGILTGVGVPGPLAAVLAGVDASIEKGELVITSGDLSRLIGRPTTPLTEAVTAALKG